MSKGPGDVLNEYDTVTACPFESAVPLIELSMMI